jgi:hypothetical protein
MFTSKRRIPSVTSGLLCSNCPIKCATEKIDRGKNGFGKAKSASRCKNHNIDKRLEGKGGKIRIGEGRIGAADFPVGTGEKGNST